MATCKRLARLCCSAQHVAEQRVGEAPFERDGIEAFDQPRTGFGFDQQSGGQLVLDDNRGEDCEADILAGEEAHHGHIIDFGGDARMDIEAGAEPVDGLAQGAFARLFGVPIGELGAWFGLMCRTERGGECWVNVFRNGPGTTDAQRLMTPRQRHAYAMMLALVEHP